MAGRNREPVDLILAKGKSKHLNKEEIERRRNSEIKAPADNVEPPRYLNKKQKDKFEDIANQLIVLDIMSNLDCDALARYIIALDLYISISKKLQKIIVNGDITEIDNVSRLQDRYFKQCRMSASDLGLSITSRCKLIIPKPPEPKKNKFSEKFGSR
ncbi:hypothetical protein SDC9_37770 [bioreactor metagenome]|uniref:Phage terminase small subunit P27 family n=1 Tax=bioreactor metagenome TaxID=1076179 RepID=A0A644VJX0_9ZZZZ